MTIKRSMANEQNRNMESDRRDPLKERSSLSGSKMRDNASTEKALHPEGDAPPAGRKDSEVEEIVDQDPGERQKENQNKEKDDPLAA